MISGTPPPSRPASNSGLEYAQRLEYAVLERNHAELQEIADEFRTMGNTPLDTAVGIAEQVSERWHERLLMLVARTLASPLDITLDYSPEAKYIGGGTFRPVSLTWWMYGDIQKSLNGLCAYRKQDYDTAMQWIEEIETQDERALRHLAADIAAPANDHAPAEAE